MTRPASTRSSIAQIGTYTKADELNASPKRPAAPGVHATRVAAARAALKALAHPETSTVAAWSICCMAGNVLETMLLQGLVQDPDGLLQDAFDALKRAAQGVHAPGEPITLSPADHALVADMIESWAALMVEAPARAIIKAFRATDRRIREIEAGRAQPHDFTIEAAA